MTKEEEVFSIVQDIIGKVAGIKKENIEGERFLQEELNLNSIDLVDVLMKIEKHFNTELPFSIIENSITVNELVNNTCKQLSF